MLKTPMVKRTQLKIAMKCQLRFAIILVMMGCSLTYRCQWVLGQSPARDESPEQVENQAIDRFLEVLLRRPRPGIALDRVYTHHVQNGSLDTFLTSINGGESDERAGQQQMVRGLIQLRRGQTSAAVASLQKADRLLPNDAMASYHLGLAWQASGRANQAVEALLRSIDRQPSRREAAEVFFELSRIQNQSGDATQAVQTLKQLQERFPGDREMGLRIARALADEKHLQAALNLYLELAETTQRPEDKVTCQIEAAELKRKLGNDKEATKDFQNLLARLRPGGWLYRNVRDRLESGFLNHSNYDGLANFYVNALARAPDDLAIKLRLGQIQAIAGQLDAAEKTLHEILVRTPNETEVRIALIDVLIRSASAPQTEPHFEKLVQLDPSNPDHFLRWAQVRSSNTDVPRRQRNQAAMEIWSRLVQTRADDPVIHARIAKLLANIGESDEAIAMYQKAIDLAPQMHQYREYLGEYFHRLRRNDDAIATWNSIASGSRRNRDSLVRLAEVFSTFDLLDDSLKAWRDAATFDLTFDQRLRYAQTLGRAKQHVQSIAQLESAATIAQSRDERERLLTAQVKQYVDSEKTFDKIAEIASLSPTAENRRFLTLLHLADGDLAMAAQTIREAISIAPDDADVLVAATKIAERQKRFFDAVQILERLVDIDNRFRTRHLQRLITLHMRLGSPTQAALFARDLIKATPNSPESHRIYAEIAFEVGKNEQAIVALRQAIDLAPRDNTSRLVLARHFSKTNQTNQALELYWEALKHQRDWSGRKQLIGEMAPLYKNHGDSEQFLRRVDQFYKVDSDRYETRRLVAMFWQAMGDHKRASFILQQLIAERPGDEGLLRQIVDCFQLLSNPTAAIKYQSQLVDLTGDFNDIEFLTKMRLNAGDVQHLELFARELASTRNPVTIGNIINRAMTHDRESAEELCRIACVQDDSLWGIKCVRLQLLLSTPNNGHTDKLSEAIRLADEIDQIDLAAKTPPPSAAPTNNQGSPQSSTASSGGELYHLKIGATTRRGMTPTSTLEIPKSDFTKYLGRALGTVDQSGRRRLGLNKTRPNILTPDDYYQAVWISRAIRILAHCRLNEIAGKRKSLTAVIRELFPLPAAEQTDDPRVLKQLLTLYYLEGSLLNSPRPEPEALLWRMADVDPQGENPQWREILGNRFTKHSPFQRSATLDSSPPAPPSPLHEQHLRILSNVVAKRQLQPASSVATVQQIDDELFLRRCMDWEFQLARKNNLQSVPPNQWPEPKSFMQALANIQVALWENEPAYADQLVSKLPQIARIGSSQDVISVLKSRSNLTWYLFPATQPEKEFVRRHRGILIDAWLAHCSRRRTLADQGVTVDQIIRQYGQGVIQLVVSDPRSPSGKSATYEVESTISNRLIDDYLLAGLSQLTHHFRTGGTAFTAMVLQGECLTVIDRQPKTASPDERRLRRIVAAFASLWQGRREDCHRQIGKLCEQFPDDIDLQIEAARMEFDLNQSDAGFVRLNNIQTKNDRDVIQVGLAKAHLSLRVGFVPPARLAANDLLQLQLGAATHTSLQKRLTEYGLNAQSVRAVIPTTRMRPSSSAPYSVATVRQDDASQLRLASELLATGNPVTASEIAHSIIENAVQSSGLNWRVLRRRAVDLLIRAKKLEPLIARMESAVQADPESEWHRQELAQLYLLNGQGEKATDLWAQVILHDGLTANQLLALADSLDSDHQPHKAAIVYLFAFERSPQLWGSNWAAFAQAAESSEHPSSIYSRLCKQEIQSYSLFSLCSVIRISDSDTFSEPQREFVRHVVQTHPDAEKKASLLKRFIPDSELEHFPQLDQ